MSFQQQTLDAINIIRPMGLLEIVTIAPMGKGIDARTFEIPKESEEAAIYANDANLKNHHNIYFAVNQLKHRINKKCKREDILDIQYAHVDVDPDLSSGYGAGRKRLQEETLRKMNGNGRSATFIIDSGNGLQGFWAYRQPLLAEQDGVGESINKQLITGFGGDLGTYDCSRIMRLPGTLNYPNKTKLDKGYPEKPSLAKLIHHDPNAIYTPDELSNALPTTSLTMESKQAVVMSIGVLSNNQKSDVRERIAQEVDKAGKFAQRWSGNTAGLNDLSRSGMDMSIGAMLKGRGLSCDEMAYVLRDMFEHGKGSDNQDRDLRRIWERSFDVTPYNIPKDIEQDLSKIARRAQSVAGGVDAVKVKYLADAMQSIFFVARSGKFMQPNDVGYLNIYTEKHLNKHVLKGCHNMIDASKFKADDSVNNELLSGALESLPEDQISQTSKPFSPVSPDDVAKAVQSGLMDYLINKRQVSEIKPCVDMFESKIGVNLLPDGVVELIHPHVPFIEDYRISSATVDRVEVDYKQHFPEFDDILRMLAAARFADDRRRAFLWLHAVSDWGKNFLVDGVFKRLGIVTEITPKEIEKAISGDPIGLDLTTAIRSWILFVDEFRYVKAEIKQINSHITGAAKHALRTTVPVYLKLFASAETVDALAGESGVDTQFAERFNYISGAGRIADRELFHELGSSCYAKALSTYVSKYLNDQVETYRALGRDEATYAAERAIQSFHSKHGITKSFGNLEDGLNDLAQDLRIFINETVFGFDNIGSGPIKALQSIIWQNAQVVLLNKTDTQSRVILLKKPSKVVKDYINVMHDESERIKVSYKTSQIISLLDIKHSPATTKKVYEIGEKNKASNVIISKGILVAVTKVTFR